MSKKSRENDSGKTFWDQQPKSSSRRKRILWNPDSEITNEDLEFLTSRVKKINRFALADRV